MALCIATAAGAGPGTWTPIGPVGGGVILLVEDPDDPSLLYAGTSQPYHLFRSRDAGRNWSPSANPGFSDSQPFKSYIPGNGAIYAMNGLAWKSNDGGFTWENLPFFPSLPESLKVTVSEPGNPQVVYGLADTGAVKSIDGGFTWQVLPGTSVPDVGGWTDMLIDSNAPSTVYLYGSSRVLKSTDAGASWNLVPTGLGFFSVSAMTQFGSTLLVATYSQGFLRSVDGGATWTPSNGGISDPRIYSLSKGLGSLPVLYATAGPPDWPALLRSVDGGITWTPSGVSGISRVVVSRHAANRLYGVALGTVAVSDDAGATLTNASYASGLPNVRTPVLLVDAGNTSVLYAAILGGPGAVRSVDRGRSWGAMTLPNGTLLAPISASRTQPGTVYATPNAGIVKAYRSADFGASWSPLGFSPDFFLVALEEAATDPQTVYVAGTRSCGGTARVPNSCPVVQRTVDGGASWAEASQGLPGGTLSGIAVAPTDARTVYARMNGHLYRTIDGGASWTDRSTGLPAGRILAMAVSPMDSAVVYVGLGTLPPSSVRGVYVTLDGGASWSARNQGLPEADVTALTIDPRDPAIVYAGVAGDSVDPTAGIPTGATGLGVFRTADAGGHWAPFGAGLGSLTSLNVNSIAVDTRDTRNVYVATDGGAYALTSSNYGAVGHAIEFYEAAFDHYFIATETQPDVIALDGGRIPGWTRAGRAFAVYPLLAAGTSPVCRFFSGQTFAPKSSHFYTAYAAECSALQQGGVWEYEGNAFALGLPAGTAGQGTCAAGSAPLYRLYNNGQGGAPNHRYADDLAVLNQMTAQGWVFEGEAQTKVFACIPAAQ
ncbi:MAG: hypothetical protein GZ089_01770 [Aromatoleum sp.]|nr:hypothetical protein [Aromatoleum sp.]